MTGIIDYNAGNIRSVELALQTLGTPYLISKSPFDLLGADRLIFPGVGEAGFAMNQLKKNGLNSFLRDWAAADKPLLGICLGSQILFDYSEEGDTPCLGIFPGTIKRFPRDFPSRGFKVPHMGWNNLDYKNGGSPLFKGIPEVSDCYFVHSYYISPKNMDCITATADYGFPVPCAVKCGNVEAFQFHPEKSGKIGLRMLSNFTGGGAC